MITAGYYIHRKINCGIQKLISNNTYKNNENDGNSKESASNVTSDKKISRLVMPYIYHITDAITKKLSKNYLIEYSCLNKLNKIVKVHKDSIPHTTHPYTYKTNEIDTRNLVRYISSRKEVDNSVLHQDRKH